MKLSNSKKLTGARVVLFVTAGLLMVLSAAVQGAQEKMIIIKGSDTMVHLVSDWAEAFMTLDPNAEVAVTGGGSGTGIAALINGTTDICASSRDMKDQEKQQAKEKGTDVREVVVARDGIAVVVNPKNALGELDMQQLEQIFTGSYTNWKQVGGPDEEILVFSRESSSGTYVFFQEHVLKKKDYTPKAKLMPATSAIIESVSSDEGAIGYVGLGYALAAKDKVKILAVKADANSVAVTPSDETVTSGSYPIARPLYLYVNTKAPENITAFVNFCLSNAGQTIVRKAGYVAFQ